MKSKEVVVTIPIYRSRLSEDEEVSYRHLLHYLGEYDLKLVAPQHLVFDDPRLEEMEVVRFDDFYFTGIPGYNRLMLSTEFYQRFSDYEYILIYQLDCLVFSSDLGAWCSKGWDYVGAPWFKDFSTDSAGGFWGVGNGGLSLRRVSSFLKVLRSRKLLQSPFALARDSEDFPHSLVLRRFKQVIKVLMYAAGYQNTMRYFVKHYPLNEDFFWATEARRVMENFVVPPPDEAVAFAFEYAPRYCLEQNGGSLPFGCHAWQKADPAFWERELLADTIDEC